MSKSPWVPPVAAGIAAIPLFFWAWLGGDDLAPPRMGYALGVSVWAYLVGLYSAKHYPDE